MNYDDFLRASGNEPLRRDLWQLFLEFSRYLRSLNFTTSIVAVDEGSPAYHFGGPKRVTIPVEEHNKGVIFHEVAHDLFHHSVFHGDHLEINKRENEEWSEAFCETLRWLMEQEHLKESNWLSDFEKRMDRDIARAKSILHHCRHTLDGFRVFWLELTRSFDNSADYLKRTIERA